MKKTSYAALLAAAISFLSLPLHVLAAGGPPPPPPDPPGHDPTPQFVVVFVAKLSDGTQIGTNGSTIHIAVGETITFQSTTPDDLDTTTDGTTGNTPDSIERWWWNDNGNWADIECYASTFTKQFNQAGQFTIELEADDDYYPPTVAQQPEQPERSDQPARDNAIAVPDPVDYVTVTPSPAYVAAGETVVLTAHAWKENGEQDIELLTTDFTWTAPDGGTMDPQADAKSSTFTPPQQAGTYRVQASHPSCAQPGTALVKKVQVTFSRNEVRPGVPDARNDTVTATITPDDVTVDFVSTHARATVAPANGSGQVNLTVNGVNLSAANKDTALQAKIGAKVYASIPITVVEPNDYSSESPSARDSIDAHLQFVYFLSVVTITIYDQFGTVLGANWQGMPMQESINQGDWKGFRWGDPSTPLDNDGTVDDHCIVIYEASSADEANAIKQCNAFPGSDVHIEQTFRTRAEVDAGQHKVLNGQCNRTQHMNKNDKSFTVTSTH